MSPGACVVFVCARGRTDSLHLRSTLSDIGIWARAHKTNGLSPVHLRGSKPDDSSTSWGLGNLSWPMLSLTGEIVRVGRLQHKKGTLDSPTPHFFSVPLIFSCKAGTPSNRHLRRPVHCLQTPSHPCCHHGSYSTQSVTKSLCRMVALMMHKSLLMTLYHSIITSSITSF